MVDGEKQGDLLEAEVIRKVRDGEREEYRHLVRAYQGEIYAMIVRMGVDEASARELTQDAFLKAYLGLSRFRGDAGFKTWLVRIALNLMRTYFKSRRYKEWCKTQMLGNENSVVLSQRESEHRFDDAMLRRVQSCIAKLKPKYREVIVLCALEQKTYREAAEILSLPVGTVCSRMNKAFQMLRWKLQED